MADARLGQTNPLSLIGRSASAPQSNEALAALTKGAVLQQLQNKGSLDVAGQQGTDAFRRQGLSQGLPINPLQASSGNLDPNVLARLGEQNTAETALKSGQAASAFRDANIGLGFPGSKFRGGQFGSQPLTGINPLTGEGFRGKGELQEAAKVVAQEDEEDTVEEPELVLPDGTVIPTPRIRKRTSKRGRKLTATKKSNDIFKATEDVLFAAGLKRGTHKGKTVIFRELGDGKREIVATQP